MSGTYYIRLTPEDTWNQQGTYTVGYVLVEDLPVRVPEILPPVNAATNVTGNSATLNGEVNPNGSETTCFFEYSVSEAYGLTTVTLNAGARSIVTEVG